jgi:hypothetical protein
MILLVGAFVEGALYPSWMQIFPSPLLPLFFLFFICFFHDPFLDRIEYFFQRWTWQDFVPPPRLHELDFEMLDDVIYALTHDLFVLDLSLFWFMMKHKGRYRGTLLDWLHWLFDYTNMQPPGKYM